MASPLMHVVQMSKWYTAGNGKQRMTILHPLSFSLDAGEFTAITGSSGSGKSTLLQLLSGMEPVSQGEIFWKGNSMQQWPEAQLCRHRNQQIGLVYQRDYLLAEFTALENVALPALIKGLSKAEAYALALYWLRQVGLHGEGNAYPHRLSGGERQRVALARALINQPEMLFADEPTGNLDDTNTERVFALLQMLQRSLGLACVLVTHDARLAAKCDRHWKLEHGQLTICR